MSTSPVPEDPLAFSPTLAETIGLAEAILLQFLTGLLRRRGLPPAGGQAPDGVRAGPDDLHAALPFWEPEVIRGILDSLAAKGMISVDLDRPGAAPLIVIADPGPQAGGADGAPAPDRPDGRWTPDEELLRLCAREHGIPEDFARAQARPFSLRRSARARSSPSHRALAAEFLDYARRRWREEEIRHAAARAASLMSHEWEPAPGTVGILTEEGVSASFIATTLPMFRIYWRDRGERRTDWDRMFVERVRGEWEREGGMRPIPDDWEPAGETVEDLESKGVPGHFIRGRVSVFRNYWRETGRRKPAWNHAFMKWVMRDWEDSRSGADHSGESDEEAVKRKIAEYSDRSWAVE